MNAETFALLVEGACRSGGGYVAHCPAHSDERASLSFADGERGLVVKCHAGCAAAAIAAAVDLRVSDFFNDDGRVHAASRVVAEYEYRDERGELLYVVERREPKTFRQRRPDGRGGWIWNLEGVRRVLYRLPELRDAMATRPKGERVLYITEGEEDVKTLRALGFVATCNPGGAGKWRDEYSDQLRAAGVERVVILPDNDAPGERHAVAVARSCSAVGLPLKIVHLPGVPPKGDVSDWVAAGHTREELAEVVRGTPLVNESTPESVSAGPAEGPVLVRLADVEPESVSWLWSRRLARGKLTLLGGDPGVGKSFVMLDVSARISRGREWPDGGHAPLGDVILLSAEDGVADTIRPRVDGLAGDPRRIHMLAAVRHEGAERAFCLAADLSALEAAVGTVRAVLVVIDPLSAYLGDRDSYKDAQVRALLSPLAALAERTGVAVGAVMHVGKAEQRRAIHRTLGSVAFVAAARIVLAAGKDPADESRRLLVPVKSNLSAPAPTLAYRVDGGGVEWEPEPVADVDADAVLGATPEDRDERRDADELLRELLGDGERRAADVLRAARENGVPERTLYRAKRRLGVKVRHEGQPGKPGGAWYWFLAADGAPKADTDSPKTATRGEVAAFGEPSEETDESALTSPKTATSRTVAAFGGSLPRVVDEDEL